jgi:hypothetical protein
MIPIAAPNARPIPGADTARLVADRIAAPFS